MKEGRLSLHDLFLPSSCIVLQSGACYLSGVPGCTQKALECAPHLVFFMLEMVPWLLYLLGHD